MQNINVINNAGNNVNVTINEKDNGIQILIDTVHNKKRLSELNQYDHFEQDGEEYILCKLFENGTASVLRADLLDKKMRFGKNNNWAESDWREYLNGEYLEVLEQKFGSENIVEHKVDLTSMDGFDDYGYTMDKVAIRTFDEFRETSKGVGLADDFEWLATPNQTPSRGDSIYVQGINSNGVVDCGGCGRGLCASVFLRKIFSLCIFEENGILVVEVGREKSTPSIFK